MSLSDGVLTPLFLGTDGRKIEGSGGISVKSRPYARRRGVLRMIHRVQSPKVGITRLRAQIRAPAYQNGASVVLEKLHSQRLDGR
jgi:hypothetical protein